MVLQGPEAIAVRLGPSAGQSEAQLDGFKSRALRAEAPMQRHLYTAEWRQVDMAGGVSAKMLIIGDDATVQCARLSSLGTLVESVAALRNGEGATIVVAEAMQHGCCATTAPSALEVALALIQTQAIKAPASNVWLLTTGGVEHAGTWGLSRSAQAEASLPLVSMHTPVVTTALVLGLALTEPEVSVLNEGKSSAPRLMTAPPSLDGLVRLHLHTRGTISNLFLEPQPALPPLGSAEVLLRVRAIGLNFRDVLNVLGEYPGDPGPPGGDAAGVVSDTLLPPFAIFGLAHAPLACVAIAAALFVADKPAALSFEQASTLPVTWSTVHVAVERAGRNAGHSMVVQAAAGGVGLKAVEYAQWLHARVVGTAGRPHKHAQLRASGALALCSSRDSAAFATGTTRLLDAGRSHTVLNSLSLDFISASFATLGERGAFEEIGKRGIWTSDRRHASAPLTMYCAIALDADMELDPLWMRSVLALLAARAGAAAATSLPLQCFDMATQHELAFRRLQSGLNTGKIVVRVAARTSRTDGAHVVTGGTGGLGLLTGRWLAQHRACRLVLASRSGALAKEAEEQWRAVQASDATASLGRCDTGEAAHVRRLLALVPSLLGVWHAAGLLVDSTIPRQVTSRDLW